MNYTSITPDQRETMLEAIGVESVDELFAVIPERSRFEGELDLPPAASELELQRELTHLADLNRGGNRLACFLGGGMYDHFIPAFIDQMISRGEFLTAYTPYQPEASQGSLQAFFEFQTQVARLTGLDIANASLYEGATAVAEAVMLALNTTGRRRVVVADTLHPHTLATLRAYLDDLPAELVVVARDEQTGAIAPNVLAAAVDKDTACIVVQSPNFFGVIEDWSACFAQAKAAGDASAPIAIAVFNPIACALLKTPGAAGADIAAGDGQPLGVPMQFGGPTVGLFAARERFIRRMPGRLVGQSTDASGRKAFTLVLQTREQHIKRDRATSNICTNQGLLALRATMFMTALGPAGLRAIAEQCWHKAHFAAQRIADLPGYRRKHTGAFFHEFVVECPKPAAAIVEACKARGVLAGLPLHSARVDRAGGERDLLIAATEKRTRADIDALVGALRDAAA